MNKNILLIKNILFLSLKFAFFFYIFVLLIFLGANAIFFPTEFTRALYLEIIIVFPFFVYFYVFLTILFLIMAFLEKAEILDDSGVNVPKPVKIWNPQNNTFISDENFTMITYPVLKVNFYLLYKKDPSKKFSNVFILPVEINKFSHPLLRFLNIKRISIPFAVETNELILVPYGGLLNKISHVPGLLIFQMKPLSRSQSIFFRIFSNFFILLPMVLFLLTI